MTDGPSTLRVAVAQFATSGDIPDASFVATTGERVRAAMKDAVAAGARLIQFPEGTLGYPHKRLISRSAPDLDEADWNRVDWRALRAELEAIGAAAADLGVWAVVGAPHWLGDGCRPHNSLFVFSDTGQLVTRYDKRRLSMTEITYLYAPGVGPVAFEVDGFSFGMVLCLETLFPDLFIEYADAGADAVLISSAGGGIFGQLARSYAAITWMTITLSIPPPEGEPSSVGACGPFGAIASATTNGEELVIVDVPKRTPPPFHRDARNGLYDSRLDPHHPRTLDRTSV